MATIDFRTAGLILERALVEANPANDDIGETIYSVLTAVTKLIVISWLMHYLQKPQIKL